MTNADRLKLSKIKSILKRHAQTNPSAKDLNIQQTFMSRSKLGLKDSFQFLLKRKSTLYNSLINIFSPVFMNPYAQKRINKLLSLYDERAVILNIGSGPTYYQGRRDIINVDIFPYNEVDIIADISKLPIKNNCVDIVIDIALLEHVTDADKAVQEICRIVKEGGYIISYIPFIQAFHASPYDFRRWTKSGIRQLFHYFNDIEIIVGAGPTSGLLWILQEWLAILLAFGNDTLHDILFLFFMVVTAPIKLLDLFLTRFPQAENIASGFYVFTKKNHD